MTTFPESEYPLLIRTDFTEESKWDALCTLIETPTMIDEFKAYVTFLNDTQFANMLTEELVTLYPSERNHICFFIADETTITHQELPVLVSVHP